MQKPENLLFECNFCHLSSILMKCHETHERDITKNILWSRQCIKQNNTHYSNSYDQLVMKKIDPPCTPNSSFRD